MGQFEEDPSSQTKQQQPQVNQASQGQTQQQQPQFNEVAQGKPQHEQRQFNQAYQGMPRQEQAYYSPQHQGQPMNPGYHYQPQYVGCPPQAMPQQNPAAGHPLHQAATQPSPFNHQQQPYTGTRGTHGSSHNQGPHINENNAWTPPVPPPMPRPTHNEGWKTGLLDCMQDPTNALITFFCPCVTFGQIAEIIDRGNTPCATSGLIYGLILGFFGVPCILSFTYRTKLRDQLGLFEAPAPDWVTHCICEYCALCQEYRELKLRDLDPSIGWQGNVARNPSLQQGVMAPPMQQRMM